SGWESLAGVCRRACRVADGQRFFSGGCTVRPATPRTVVICGASAGVGRACAQAFARTGARVALLARGRVGLAAAHAEVEALGGVAWSQTLDVADAVQVDEAAARIESELGPIDVWVNNAM